MKNGLILPTLVTHGGKTVYPREFITEFKDILNVVFDNFHIDQNTVRSNLENFWSNLEAHEGRTVQNGKFIMKI